MWITLWSKKKLDSKPFFPSQQLVIMLILIQMKHYSNFMYVWWVFATKASQKDKLGCSMHVPIFYSGIQDNGSNSSIVCLIRFTDFWQSEVSFFDQSLLRLEEDYAVLPTLCYDAKFTSFRITKNASFFSGLDNSICTYGGIMSFTSGMLNNFLVFSVANYLPKIALILQENLYVPCQPLSPDLYGYF